MKTLPTIVTVLRIAVGFALSAGPASAQSFCTCDGTGNVLVFANQAFMPAKGKAAVNDHALRAYAAAPARGLAGDSNTLPPQAAAAPDTTRCCATFDPGKRQENRAGFGLPCFRKIYAGSGMKRVLAES